MKCEKCGQEIESLEVNVFDYDGSDRYYGITVVECEQDAAYVDADHNWTGYELSDEERLETIRCPKCKQFPFQDSEIQVCEIVRVVCFKKGRENDG